MVDDIVQFDKSIYLIKSTPELVSVTITWNNTVRFDRTIYVQAPQVQFDKSAYLINSTPELISTTLVFSSTFVTGSFDRTIITAKTSSVSFDRQVHLQIRALFDRSIHLQKTGSFDKRIFLFLNASGAPVFDRLILLSKPVTAIFDRIITVTYVNGPQYISFDKSIYLEGGAPELTSVTLAYTLVPMQKFDRSIILIKTSMQTFDRMINIQSTVKFDRLILLAKALTLSQFDKSIILTKTSTKTFNRVVYLSKATGAAISFDKTVILTRNGTDDESVDIGGGVHSDKKRFDRTIILIKDIIVAQVGDVVRDSRGRGVGIIAGGVDFT